MMKKYVFPIGCLLCWPVFSSDHDDVHQAVMAGRFRPLAEILATVQAQHPGQVLDVELDRDHDGRHVYEVKLLSGEGKRQEIHIDAMTGLEVRHTPAPPVKAIEDLLRDVLRVYPGHVVDVDLHRQGARFLYQVRIMNAGGEMQDVLVDAHSGELLSFAERLPIPSDMQALPDVLARVLREYPALLVETELKYDARGNPFYEIDLQRDNGELLELFLDPRTGRLLGDDELGGR